MNHPADQQPSQIKRIPAPSRRKKKRRSLPAWAVGLLLVAPVLLVILYSVRQPGSKLFAVEEKPTPTPADTQPGGIFITATLLPTPVLPLEYILSLSATPTETPAASAGGSESFVTATPQFMLATSQIVYVCFLGGSDEICLMNADGSNIRRLTDSPGTDWYPSFSPDMQRIAFSSQRNGSFDIYVMNIDGSNLRRLTQQHADNYAPAFSPDGRWIVFTSTYGEGDQNIWLMAADGSSLTQLTYQASDDIDPMWSPDGKYISFASSRSGTTELFVMSADGTNVRQITDTVHIGGRNDWSPDGRWLTFYAGPARDKNIFMASIDCGVREKGCPITELTQLTFEGNNKGPSFSPDGNWITYASLIDGDNEIFLVRVDGSEIRQLTTNSYADWQPRWRP